MKIFKYRIPIKSQTVAVPKGASLLSVAAKDDGIFSWFLADEGQEEMELREFKIFGTGEEITSHGRFAATVFLFQGSLVFHVFEAA